MTTALDTIRYHSGIAGEEVAELVDSLEQEVSTLREQVKKLEALVVMRCDLEVPPQFSQGLQSHEVLEPVTAEHCQWFVAEIEKLTKERDELHRAFNQPVPRSEWEKMQEQLAALAEQNEKFRETLSRWRYQNLSYNWCCGNCGAVDGDEHKEGCALSLPNLATPVLNRIRAEGMRMAAEICEHISDEYREREGRRYPELKTDAESGASDCESSIRAQAHELENSNG